MWAAGGPATVNAAVGCRSAKSSLEQTTKMNAMAAAEARSAKDIEAFVFVLYYAPRWLKRYTEGTHNTMNGGTDGETLEPRCLRLRERGQYSPFLFEGRQRGKQCMFVYRDAITWLTGRQCTGRMRQPF